MIKSKSVGANLLLSFYGKDEASSNPPWCCLSALGPLVFWFSSFVKSPSNDFLEYFIANLMWLRVYLYVYFLLESHNSMWIHQCQTLCKYPIFNRVRGNGCQSTLYSSHIPLGFLTFTYLGLSVDCSSRNICNIHLHSLTPLGMVMPQTFGLYPFMFFK